MKMRKSPTRCREYQKADSKSIDVQLFKRFFFTTGSFRSAKSERIDNSKKLTEYGAERVKGNQNVLKRKYFNWLLPKGC
jgi:hypothetical protein